MGVAFIGDARLDFGFEDLGRDVGNDYQLEHARRPGPSATYEVVEGSHLIQHIDPERIVQATIDLTTTQPPRASR